MTKNFTTHYSLPSLIKAGKKLAAGKEIVSFDLFDTLLVRRIHDPDLVKLPVARFISRLASHTGYQWSSEKVQMRRDAIEREHRKETGRSFEDHEACYPRFMAELLGEIFQKDYSLQLLEKVTAYELEMENSMLVPRRQLKEWVVELAGQGKRIFVVSDMYLPASHLEILVRHAGLHEYIEAVVSSADTFLAKASGKGYQQMMKRFGLAPEKWLHVGDNPFSDGLRATENGIDALIIHDPREDQRKSIVKRMYNYSDGRPFWRGRVLQQLMAPLEGENVPRSQLYREGYNFLGPLIGTFVMDIAERCQKHGITKLFFLSREGWTFKKYWEEAMPILFPGGDLPEIEYLYVSRMALAGASCAHQGLIKSNADIAFLPSGNRDFRDVCRIFSLDPDHYTAHLHRYGIAADTCLSIVHDGFAQENRKRYEAMLGDEEFQDEILRRTRDMGLALERYLEEVGFFSHKKVGLVDIGWLGTIQRFLFEAVAHREDRPGCHGFLFGATRGIPYPESDDNRIEGVMYDKDRFDLAASTIFYIQDLFEESCRAPHPTLNGYRLTNDGYELVFRQTEDAIGQAEQEQDSYFSPLQQGIFDSAQRFGHASAMLGYSRQEYKPWFNYLLVSKLAFPSADEVKYVKHRHHLDDFHGSKKPKADFYTGNLGLWQTAQWRLKFDPFIRLRHFLHHLRNRINQ